MRKRPGMSEAEIRRWAGKAPMPLRSGWTQLSKKLSLDGLNAGQTTTVLIHAEKKPVKRRTPRLILAANLVLSTIIIGLVVSTLSGLVTIPWLPIRGTLQTTFTSNAALITSESQPTSMQTTATFTPTPTPEPPIQEVMLKDVWADVPIIQISRNSRAVLALSDEGDLLTSESIKIVRTDGIIGNDKYDHVIYLNNIYDDSEEVIHKIFTPRTLLYECINADWVVWIEASTSNGMAFENVEIKVFNRKTKEIDLIFPRPGEKEGITNIGGMPSLELKDNKLLFCFNFLDNKNNSVSSGEYNLITGAFTIIAENFKEPHFGSNGYFGRVDDPTQTGYQTIYKIENNIRKPQMTNSERITYFACDSDAFAISATPINTEKTQDEKASTGAGLWLFEEGEKKFIQQARPNSGFGWLSLSKRLLAWTYGSGAYVYDRKIDKIVRLTIAGENTYSASTTEKYLTWFGPSESDIASKKPGATSILNIIEIDKLP